MVTPTLAEIVCPQFYVTHWEAEGRKYTDVPGVEFERAADDGVCRLMHAERDPVTKKLLLTAGETTLVCRCGIRFAVSFGQRIEVVR